MSNISTTMGGFTPLFEVVVQDVGIIGAAVFGRVWRYSKGKYGVCQAATSTIADELGMSRHTILRWLKDLCEKGYLEDTTPDLRNRPHTYAVTGKVKLQIRLDAVAESDTDGIGVAESNSAVAESNTHCSRKSHEERKKREEKREEPSPDENQDADIDPDILFGDDKKRPPTTKTSSVLPFTPTGDVLSDTVQAARLKQERNIPDWAIKGAEGPSPYFEVLLCFCKMTAQSVESLNGKGKTWLDHLEQFGLDNGLSPGAMVKAHRVLPNKEWGQWYLEHHQWTNPMVTSYLERLRVAAVQIQDGTLEAASVDGWSHSL